MSSNEQDELPNYMLPNFASILPEYSNVEADQIRNAFSVGNFQSLTKIPNKLGPNQVWKARQSQIDQNREENKQRFLKVCFDTQEEKTSWLLTLEFAVSAATSKQRKASNSSRNVVNPGDVEDDDGVWI